MVGSGRRRVQPALVAVCASLVVVAGVVAVTRASGGTPRRATRGAASTPVVTASPAAATPASTAPAQDPATAFVDVSVATVWTAPGQARPVDEPILGKPVDMARWVASMSRADKLWLVDKLATQVLYGDAVRVLEQRGAWTHVAVPRQPSSLDPRGYPGWMPTAQLSPGPVADTGRYAVVTRPTAPLHDPASPDRLLLDLSYDTRLPVVAVDSKGVTVATPTGRGVLAAGDVVVQGGAPPAPTGAELVRSAQLFAGLPYLWAGTSSSGFDCSGLTSAVYGAHGIVLPRDADDQAAAGTPVEPARLEPGDLLFYAYDGGRGAIHHVSMYVGDGLMIQSPSTGKTVETVPVDSAGFAGEFWGARRYLPPVAR